MKLPELNSFGDREVKALNVGLHIRRRPLLAFGNSDGDQDNQPFGLAAGAAFGLDPQARRDYGYAADTTLAPIVQRCL